MSIKRWLAPVLIGVSMCVSAQSDNLVLFSKNNKSNEVHEVKSPSGNLQLHLNNSLIKKGSNFYSGDVLMHPNAVFNITQESNDARGFVWLKDENVTYKITTENGALKLTLSDINEFLCIDYGEKELAETIDGFVPEIQATVPILESNPGAPTTIYLDFDGETVQGTRWNGQNGIPEIFEAGPRGFTTTQMEEIYKYVAADYLPFNVNVTTNRTVFDATPIEDRVMCIFTSDAFIPAGGIAFIGSFNHEIYDDPCFVFQVILHLTATSASHEIGHTLGLNHDSSPGSIYYEGHNDWGPLMGIAFDMKMDQWCKGEYTGANNFEDDLEVMTQFGMSFRTDDHGDDFQNATNLTLANDIIEEDNKGIIEQNTDVDYFAFECRGGAIDILIDPITPKTNLRPLVKLSDAQGVLIASHSDDHPATRAFFNQNLAAGRYYLSVEGTGWGDPYTDGFTDYGSLGDYKITGTIAEGDVTSVNSVKQDSFKLYPNPTSNLLVIDAESVLQEVKVIDVLGQIVLVAKSNLIDVSELSSGNYNMVVVFENGVVAHQSFIKK